MQLNEGGAELLRTVKWQKTCALLEIGFAIIAPETSSTEQQSTTTQDPSSTEVVGLEATALPSSPKQQSPGVVRRFGPAITENELLTAIETRVPIKTKKTTTWGVNLWRERTQCRGSE